MSLPLVRVLLATYNGLGWLPEQVDSILAQEGVQVQLFVSDDASSDGTPDWLRQRAATEARISLLPPAAGRFGAAAGNFFRLLAEVSLEGEAYVAFADQDDLWFPDKLARAVARLAQGDVAAVSSNVQAFWPDGRSQLVDKAQPQQAFDFLFEAAGPGCTYVMTPGLARAARDDLACLPDDGRPAHHDWYCYALCRARGESWFIDPRPSMAYRQHGGNEVGVNSGLGAAQGRHRKIASGWYRREVFGMVELARRQGQPDAALAQLASRLQRGSLADRIALAAQVGQFRRRGRDRLMLAAYFLSGLFWGGRV